MSKIKRPDPAATADTAEAAPAREAQQGPGVEAVRQAAERHGTRSTAPYVEILNANPGERAEIMDVIHELLGMSFAAQVTSDLEGTVSADDGVVSADDGTVDSPVPDAAAPAPAPEVAPAPAVAAPTPAPAPEVAPAVAPAPAPEVAPAPAVAAAPDPGIVSTDDGIVSTDSGLVEDAAPPAPTPVATPAWIAAAEAYNQAHAHHVAAFNKATGGICMGANGQLDPQKVADWQAQNGLDPDGKVGPQTAAAAERGATASPAAPAPATAAPPADDGTVDSPFQQ